MHLIFLLENTESLNELELLSTLKKSSILTEWKKLAKRHLVAIKLSVF
jgi:hypothetical protein